MITKGRKEFDSFGSIPTSPQGLLLRPARRPVHDIAMGWTEFHTFNMHLTPCPFTVSLPHARLAGLSYNNKFGSDRPIYL